MLRAIALFLNEFRVFFRFFWKTPNEDKTIVFYAEHEGYYPYLEGIIENLAIELKHKVCYITSDPDDPILQSLNTRITSFHVNKLLPFLMLFIKSKVIVMTMTDLNQLHVRRSINPAHYVYVFHSLVSTHMVYRYGAFDHYDSILCVGPYQIEEIRKHEKLLNIKPKILVEAGYYRLERVYNAYKKYKQNNPSPTDRKTVLIAPSWGDKNTLESCGERLIEVLLSEGFEVIVRPHPETIHGSPKLIASFRNSFSSNPDFNLELSVSTDDSLLRSDILITDFSGITFEYAFGTERPVLFMDVPMKIRNQRYEEIGKEPFELSIRSEVGIILSPDELENVTQVINKLLQEKESYRTRIMELRKKKIYAFGNSSKIGAQFITDIVNNKDIKGLYNTVDTGSK